MSSPRNHAPGPVGFGSPEADAPRRHPGIFKVANQGWLSNVYDRDTETMLASVYDRNRSPLPAPLPKEGWFGAAYPRQAPHRPQEPRHSMTRPQREETLRPQETRHFMTRLLETSRAEKPSAFGLLDISRADKPPAFGRLGVGTAPVEGPPIEWRSPAAPPPQTPRLHLEKLKADPLEEMEALTPRAAARASGEARRGPRASGEARDLRREVEDLTRDLRVKALNLQDMTREEAPPPSARALKFEPSAELEAAQKKSLSLGGDLLDIQRETRELSEELAALKRMTERVKEQSACDDLAQGSLSRTLWDMQAACDGLARGGSPEGTAPTHAREPELGQGTWKVEGRVLVL